MKFINFIWWVVDTHSGFVVCMTHHNSPPLLEPLLLYDCLLVSIMKILFYIYRTANRSLVSRKYLRSLDTTPEMTEELFQGGFRPQVIIGMMTKRRRIFYFGQWVRNCRRETYILEASVVKCNYPNLVIDFHQQMILKKNRFEKIWK